MDNKIVPNGTDYNMEIVKEYLIKFRTFENGI